MAAARILVVVCLLIAFLSRVDGVALRPRATLFEIGHRTAATVAASRRHQKYSFV